MSSTGANKDREEPLDPKESDERRRYNSGSKKERSTEKPRREYSEVPSDTERQAKEEKYRRRKTEVQVVSSPESDTQVLVEEEDEMEEAKSASSSSSSSDSSDDGNSDYFKFILTLTYQLKLHFFV